jgi:Carbohydrate-selective porin, OprB family
MKTTNFSYWLLQKFSCLACLSVLAFAANVNAQVKTSNVKTSVIDRSIAEIVTPSSDLNLPRNLTAQTSPDNNYSSELKAADTTQTDTATLDRIEQATKSSEIKPTDWAYQTLVALSNKYQCSRIPTGDRTLSREEFAISLNSCLVSMENLVALDRKRNRPAIRKRPPVAKPPVVAPPPAEPESVPTTPLVTPPPPQNSVSQKDLEELKQLTQAFGTELKALDTRLQELESKTAKLEKQQFSATTKLSGLVFFNITGTSSADNLLVETGSRNPVTGQPVVGTATKPNTTFSNLVWLTLKSSFTGKDLLVTQLAAGNGNSPYNNYNQNSSFGFFNTTGVPFTDQTAGTGSNQVVLRELSYQLPVLDKASLVVGPMVNFYKYFDDNRFTFPLNGATSFNSINSTLLTNAKRGAGAVFITPLGDQFDFRIGYLSEANEFLPGARSASNPASGLFGGNNALTAEVGFKPTDNSKIRLLYSRTNSQAVNGLVGGSGATPSLPGVADDGFGGQLSNGQSDVLAANFDWLLAKQFGLFGRYGVSTTNLNRVAGGSAGNVTTQTFQVGMAFPDLFKEGALGTLSFVMPFNFTSGRNLLVAGAGNGGIQYDIEAAVSLPIDNNITVVPAAYLILNPNNFTGNPSVFVGNLRLQYSF